MRHLPCDKQERKREMNKNFVLLFGKDKTAYVRRYHLRNRKRFACLHKVNTNGSLGERISRFFLQLFRVLPNFHECYHNFTETRK